MNAIQDLNKSSCSYRDFTSCSLCWTYGLYLITVVEYSTHLKLSV